MRNVLVLFAAVAFFALFEGARQLLRWAEERRQEELRRRLRALGSPEAGAPQSLLRTDRFARSAALDAFLRKVPLALRLQRLLLQADWDATVAQVLSWSCLTACAAGFAVMALFRSNFVLTLAAFGLGASIPFMLLAIARDRRSRKLSEQLPDALDMMGRSLRAGHALTAAFEVVASEMPEPVAVEFGRAFEGQRLGLSIEQAVVEMTERAPANRDLKIFAVSLLIQRETGGNLAEILSNISETIRARYRFYGKLRALTGEGRASAAVLGALPILMAVILHLLNPHYLDPLVTTPLGRTFAIGAVLAWFAGLVWLFRLTKLDI